MISFTQILFSINKVAPYFRMYFDHSHQSFFHISSNPLTAVASIPIKLTSVHMMLQSSYNRVRFFFYIVLKQSVVQCYVSMTSFLK